MKKGTMIHFIYASIDRDSFSEYRKRVSDKNQRKEKLQIFWLDQFRYSGRVLEVHKHASRCYVKAFHSHMQMHHGTLSVDVQWAHEQREYTPSFDLIWVYWINELGVPKTANQW